MKIENVQDGFAGLLLRIDGNGQSIEFDNMQNRNINGTRDWHKYKITLHYPVEGEVIYVAGLLSGKGKAWFDDFTVSINGGDIQTLKEIEKAEPLAKSDDEFRHGSNFVLEYANQQQLNNLFILCKIWGFVKYHHPEIAKGNINWDYELFRMLPAIQDEDFKDIVYQWIESLGDLNEKKEDIVEEEDIKLYPDKAWINDKKLLSSEISQLLNEIQDVKKEKSHYYLRFVRNVGNPVFKNEHHYPKMVYTDTGYSLLALFRYWNIIEYFFPYRHLMDDDWDMVLEEFIPIFISCKDKLSYKLTLLELIGKVQDTHANIWDNRDLSTFYGKKTAPLEINFVENKALVVRLFEGLDSNSKIKIGDIVTKINGVETERIVEHHIRYSPASNYTTQLKNITGRLLRTNEDHIQVTIKNEGLGFQERLTTVDYGKVDFRKTDISSHKVLKGDIGYIYPGALKSGEIDTIMGSFINMRCLIIDLRCYPSDFIVFSLGKYLMPQPTEFAKFTVGSLVNPGQFSFTKIMKTGENNPDYFKGKVIILVNEETISQAEYTTMALRVAPRARVVGSTTAAADGNYSRIVLPGNIRTGISGIGVYYPDGTETQRIGIIPDVELRPTIEGIRNGKDELLEKAIELID